MKNKLKIGDKVRFPFAGTTHIGEFIGTHEMEYGTIKRVYYRCKGKDGTVYPVDISAITKI
jgi:hypothetical protein